MASVRAFLHQGPPGDYLCPKGRVLTARDGVYIVTHDASAGPIMEGRTTLVPADEFEAEYRSERGLDSTERQRWVRST